MTSKFREYFPRGVQPGEVIPYAHKGEWAVHELLPFLFSEVGTFHLSLATFNVSEDSLRPIFMKERGELLSIKFSSITMSSDIRSTCCFFLPASLIMYVHHRRT